MLRGSTSWRHAVSLVGITTTRTQMPVSLHCSASMSGCGGVASRDPGGALDAARLDVVAARCLARGYNNDADADARIPSLLCIDVRLRRRRVAGPRRGVGCCEARRRGGTLSRSWV